MVPAVVTISYINYAIVAVLGGIMALQGLTDVGSLASYLVFVRQAAAPINQFTQQSNFLLAAMAGAEGTSTMVARFGRAKNLGERAIGHCDPGAVSMALILQFMAEFPHTR